jgi:hypothetical protein
MAGKPRRGTKATAEADILSFDKISKRDTFTHIQQTYTMSRRSMAVVLMCIVMLLGSSYAKIEQVRVVHLWASLNDTMHHATCRLPWLCWASYHLRHLGRMHAEYSSTQQAYVCLYYLLPCFLAHHRVRPHVSLSMRPVTRSWR